MSAAAWLMVSPPPLPPPPPPPHSAYHYMQYIDLLVEDIPRVLLVRGYKQDVVTVFS